MENSTMKARRGLDYYRGIIEGLEPGTIERLDREESGPQGGAFWDEGGTITYEHEQGGGAYTFASMCRSDQAALLRVLDENLPTRTTRPNTNTPTSYAIKHAAERCTGFYVSNLQAKVAMRILGYKRSAGGLNPVYNITKREWRAFSALSVNVEARRDEARRRIARRDEQAACARYFYRIARTA